MNFIDILYIIASSLFILFLPGFVFTLVFFDWERIDIIERVTLSFALSISLVPLLVFYTNLLGIKITKLSVTAETAFLILTGVIILAIKQTLRK